MEQEGIPKKTFRIKKKACRTKGEDWVRTSSNVTNPLFKTTELKEGQPRQQESSGPRGGKRKSVG